MKINSGILMFILAIIFAGCSHVSPYYRHNTFRVKDSGDLKEGDIVFHRSSSSQSVYVAMATSSQLTHCGIVVRSKGRTYVLEASNVVKLTPVDKWISRGRKGRCYARRIFKGNPPEIKYNKYLGTRYDLEFKFDNSRFYCSELVWVIYKDQFGIRIGSPRKVSTYNIVGMSKLLKKRNISRNQKVISPKDVYRAAIY